MANQTAKMISIKELNGKSFYVPAYQRGFRWNNQQIKELIEDLHVFSNPDANNQSQKTYCLQPIVVKPKRDGSYELIDGQQRLTALNILSSYFRLSAIYNEEPTSYNVLDYKLIYEGKPQFGNLIKTLQEKPSSVDEFLNSELCEKCTDIDSKNLINNLKFIKSHEKIISKLAEIFGFGLKRCDKYPDSKDICVIWHEICKTDVCGEQDNDNYSIDVFANINANKIPLTESELIKAVILHRFGNDSEQEAVAHQWETIERGLSNNKMWHFFMSGNEKYETRIDLLFEVWYYCQEKNQEDGVKVPSGEHKLLRAVNTYFEKNGNTAHNLWKNIVEIFETIQDWYNDYENYHLIGLLSELSKSKGHDFVKYLYVEYQKNNKSEFGKKLRTEIFDAMKDTKIIESVDNDKLTLDDIVLDEINYDKTTKFAKKVLFAYNVSLLINAQIKSKNNTYERFPFDYYRRKGVFTDIEHINPQSPDKNQDSKAWTEFIKCVLSDTELQITEEQKEALDNGILSDEMKKKLDNETNVHEIGNLVLLDAAINRSHNYSNSNYSEKRREIIKAIHGKAYYDSIVLPGTRWVFNREYDSADNSIKPIWTKQDQDEYKESIRNNLYVLFRGELSENERGS